MTKRLKILILEDNPADVTLLLRELEKTGIAFVHELSDGRESYIKALHVFRPDIILSDYSLPGIDGRTAFLIKQKVYPNIPFIIISGTIGEENAIELIKNGITDYALKDKLFVIGSKINRALQETREKEQKNAESEKMRIRQEKMMSIAFLQSHQVRRPVASILGLISLLKINKPLDSENQKIVDKLHIAASELDQIIIEIVKKTEDLLSIE